MVTINDWLVEPQNVIGDSMAPTLSPSYNETGMHDVLVMWKMSPWLNLQRGQIVSYFAPHDPNKTSIKRIVALDGDTVYPRRGKWGEHLQGQGLTVPYGYVWVEGDNWRKSLDSNDFGPLQKSMIVGRAGFVLGSSSNGSWLPNFTRFGTQPTEEFKSRTRVKKAMQRPKRPPEWDM